MVSISFIDALELINKEKDLEDLLVIVEEAKGWLIMRDINDKVRKNLYDKIEVAYHNRYEKILTEMIERGI